MQEDGIYDFIDPDTFNGVSHIELPKQSKVKTSKARLTQRGGDLAVAADNGLAFLRHGTGGANLPNVSLLDERYLKGKMVTDFVEYERDKFFVSVLKDSYFYLLTRFADESKMIKIRSIHSSYVTMGL